ncbi:LysR family transcriptional regulator [Pseudosporangium ferrugineum]|uniref:DNA-binding transcriptional LysR family regulator n=1 Tax=Pseudosporangium ferrugineum TaxID=439699 RepID=A0A2T0S4G6_9ACTN|nr:LysR family transcriptional regulator [Pseudosporangium ferrugineum]PRY28320.1 DNA-binding transcriptional LysR family regulator [Pseudosporangium ferrugineum]
MDVRFHQLRALVAVAGAGSFTDAAAQLGVSQAAVSRAVAALEKELGARIVERTTRHVTLTPLGVRIVAQAQRVLAEVALLTRMATERRELRVGYAWAALGRHTRRLQKQWAAARPDLPLIFVQAIDPTGGLADGSSDVAVIRWALDDPRFATAGIGYESRYAAVATDSALARRRSLRIADLARYTVAIDSRTGSTTLDLFPPDAPPRALRETGAVDEWLTLIAAGQAVGITAEATAHQYPRPGVAYRVLRHAPRIAVRLAWWREDPPRHLEELVAAARTLWGGSAAEGGKGPGEETGDGLR